LEKETEISESNKKKKIERNRTWRKHETELGEEIERNKVDKNRNK
jgi:hypothetical protein